MYGYYSLEGSNKSKSCVLYSPEIDLVDLRSQRDVNKQKTN
jgi:hypothetical protein